MARQEKYHQTIKQLPCGHPTANLNVYGGKGLSARSDVFCCVCEELVKHDAERKAQTAAMLEKLASTWGSAVEELQEGVKDSPSHDPKRMIKERSEAFNICIKELRAIIPTDHAAALAEHDSKIRDSMLEAFAARTKLDESKMAERIQQAVREGDARFARIIMAGFYYNPGHSDLDDEQPIHVSITLGDYRKARRAAQSAAARAPFTKSVQYKPEDKK